MLRTVLCAAPHVVPAACQRSEPAVSHGAMDEEEDEGVREDMDTGAGAGAGASEAAELVHEPTEQQQAEEATTQQRRAKVRVTVTSMSLSAGVEGSREQKRRVISRLRGAVERCAHAQRMALRIANAAVLDATDGELEELEARTVAGRKTDGVFFDIADTVFSAAVAYRGARCAATDRAAARRLPASFVDRVTAAAGVVFGDFGLPRTPMTTKLGEGVVKTMAVAMQEHVVRAVVRGESQLAKWLLHRAGALFAEDGETGDEEDAAGDGGDEAGEVAQAAPDAEGDEKAWAKMHAQVRRAMRGERLSWPPGLRGDDHQRGREIVEAGVRDVLHAKPVASPADALASAMREEKRRWRGVDDEKYAKYTQACIAKLVARGAFAAVRDDFPDTAAELDGAEGGAIRRPIPTDGEHVIKLHGPIRYLSYLKYLRSQADACMAEARVARCRGAMRPLTVLPLGRAGPVFVRFDCAAMHETLGDVPGLACRQRAAKRDGEMLRRVLRRGLVRAARRIAGVTTTGDGRGVDEAVDDVQVVDVVQTIKSVLTDGATLVVSTAMETASAPPGFHLTPGYFDLANDDKRARLAHRWGTKDRPLPHHVLQRPLHLWSGVCAHEQLRTALLSKLQGIDATKVRKRADLECACGELRHALDGRVNFVAIDPGKESIVYAVRDALPVGALQEYAPPAERPGAPTVAPGRYIPEALADRVLADRARYRLRGIVHQRLKGRQKGAAVELRWRRRTGADRAFAAKARLAELLGRGTSAAMLAMCALEQRGELLEAAAELVDHEGMTTEARIAAIRDLMRPPGQPDPAGPALPAAAATDPVHRYHFGQDAKLARTARRERFRRRRHEAVTANRILDRGPRTGEAAPPDSRTRRMHAAGRALCGEQMWARRFDARRAHADLRRELRREIGREKRRCRRERVDAAAVDERVARIEERYAARLAEAERAELAERRDLNRAFAAARREHHPRPTTPEERRAGGVARRAARRARLGALRRELRGENEGNTRRLTVVLLGNGSLCPGVNGHAPASHMALAAELSRRPGVVVVPVDEHRSTKLCCLCAGEMAKIEDAPRHKHCPTAGCRFHGQRVNRDRNAAANILMLGVRQLLWDVRPLPWCREKTKRKKEGKTASRKRARAGNLASHRQPK